MSNLLLEITLCLIFVASVGCFWTVRGGCCCSMDFPCLLQWQRTVCIYLTDEVETAAAQHRGRQPLS
jgi:hypothetical protein